MQSTPAESTQAESKFHQFKLRVQLKVFTALCRDAKYYDEHGCLSVCPLASQKQHVPTSQNFLYVISGAVARSSSKDNGIHYYFRVCKWRHVSI